jgi:arginase
MSSQLVQSTPILELIGVPTSAASYAPGQEKAPQELRHAGLVEALEQAGLQVIDRGDLPIQRWQPDRTNPYAQNLTAVVDYVIQTRERVEKAVVAGHIPLVLGGNCTLEIGTVAGHLSTVERVGLIYLDLHADLNTPNSTTNGALDWMGMAHMLNVDGALPELARIGRQTPLLSPSDVVFFGFDPNNATEWELEQIEQLNLQIVTSDEVAIDPVDKATRILNEWGTQYDRLLIHFDVDVIDFVDLPLSENYSRNEGLSFEQTMQALTAFLKSEQFGALTITELNPDHGSEDGSTLRKFVRALANALSHSRLNLRNQEFLLSKEAL